jgi:hypothetical protein
MDGDMPATGRSRESSVLRRVIGRCNFMAFWKIGSYR